MFSAVTLFVCLCEVFWDANYNSTYLSCNDFVSFSFLFSFFFVNDLVASFQLKQIVLFF